MTTTESSSGLQWKWVGITFIFYVAFYLLPLLIAAEIFPRNPIIPGIWIFGGIIIVAAIAGYLSKGVTIWEPAIAGIGLVILLFGYLSFFAFPTQFRGSLQSFIVALIIPAVIVFFLSLLGAWFGERAQKLLKQKTREST